LILVELGAASRKSKAGKHFILNGQETAVESFLLSLAKLNGVTLATLFGVFFQNGMLPL
jgi:hypothetical protein